MKNHMDRGLGHLVLYRTSVLSLLLLFHGNDVGMD
jgi:hypothetical protein